ncbi:MAG: hypothetical protein AAGB93_17835 [Planctomycetota bacterium]
MGLAVSGACLLAAFWLLDVPASPPSAGGLRTALLLGALAALPVTAEVFGSPERSGLARRLRHLPSRARTVVLARLILLACAILLVAASMVVAESLANLFTPLASGTARPIHELLDQSSRGKRVDLWWLVALGIHVVTAACAVVGRNALFATVAGVMLTAGAAALGARVADGAGISAPLAVVALGTLLLLNALSLSAMGATVLALTNHRGRAARSGILRAGLIVGVPLAVGSTTAAGIAIATGWQGAPPFDEPNGEVSRLAISRDGKSVALVLRQPYGFRDAVDSLWVAATDDLVFERVAGISPGRWTAGLEGTRLELMEWEADDDRVLVRFADRLSGLDSPACLSVDPRTGESTPLGAGELRAHRTGGGTFVEWIHDGRPRLLVHAASGRVVDIGTAHPRVPKISRDAVFYADEDHLLHRVDLDSGTDTFVGVDVGEERRFKIGPYGTHCVVRDGARSRLVELATGRSRDLPLFWGQWTRQEGVIVRYEYGWTLASVDGDVRLPTEKFTHSLQELPDGRWLGTDHIEAAIFLFAPDGALERTIRVGRSAE